MKIAINRCYGGFGLSEVLFRELGIIWDEFGCINNDDLGIDSDNRYAYRADPRLVAAIEKIGEEKASGAYAKVAIVDIPNDVKWQINEYDGFETIHEVHRSWPTYS